MKKILTGAEAAANAIRQTDPDVFAAYPITPQTPIIETFCKFVADGDVGTELIDAESEHSAMSAVIGASAAGARAMTATSSQGLAYMFEAVNIAPSMRLPIVMPVVNRAISGPINIHCDHSDIMPLRDSGWMIFFCETAQEVYDITLIALKSAEKSLVPAMVNQDGFITSHCKEEVSILDDNKAKSFLGEYRPKHSLLNTKKPITIGAFDMFSYYFEHKLQQIRALENAKNTIKKTFEEYLKLTRRKYDFVEEYKLKDADYVIVATSSTAGTLKYVINSLRAKNRKVGLLKLTLFRPFPLQEVKDALKNARAVAVLDRAASPGAEGGPLYLEIKSALYGSQAKISPYVFGLGGRDITPEMLEGVFNDIAKNNKKDEIIYLGAKE